jgi:hypothetical protein
MKPINVRLLAVTLAGALLLSGCHSTQSLDVETFRNNPDLVKPGDTVTLHTHTQGKIKGKVQSSSADEVVLKGGRIVRVDQVVAVEVSRFSEGKTVVAGLLILAGAAVVVGIVIGLGYLYGHTA